MEAKLNQQQQIIQQMKQKIMQESQNNTNSFVTKKQLKEATEAGRKYWEEHMSQFPNIDWAANSYYSWNIAVVYNTNLINE